MSTSAFHRLPEELITRIVEHFIESTTETTIPEFKNLRLVHPHLGHLWIIKRELFQTIHLRPDPRRLGNEDAIRSIASYVRHVIFEPTTLRRSTCQALNFSVMRARQQLERDVFHLVNHDAVGEFASIIRLLENLQSVAIMEAKVASEKDTLVPRGDALMALALMSMNEACFKPQKLLIDHYPQSEFDWSGRFACWKDLNLSELRILHFHAMTDTRKEIVWQYRPDPFGQIPPPEVTGFEPDSTLSELLDRCASSLEELSCRCPALMFGYSWQSRLASVLPRLRKLEISDCLIEADLFSTWMKSCGRLDYLSLIKLRTTTGDALLQWRPVFDAIRDHEKNMTVNFNELDLWAGLRWRLTLRHHTSEPANLSTGCYPPKLCFYLKNYMSNQRGWLSQEEQIHDISPV